MALELELMVVPEPVLAGLLGSGLVLVLGCSELPGIFAKELLAARRTLVPARVVRLDPARQTRLSEDMATVVDHDRSVLGVERLLTDSALHNNKGREETLCVGWARHG